MDKENQEKTLNTQDNQEDTKENNEEPTTDVQETKENTEETVTKNETNANDVEQKTTCPACDEYNKDEFLENGPTFEEEEDSEADEFFDEDVNEETEANKNKQRNLLIGIGVAVIVFVLFCFTTPFNKTEKTVCAPKEKSSLALTITMESKDGKVIKLSQKETTDLKQYNMTAKEFKTAAKEIKKGTKTYDGLSYTYEVKDGVGIETLTLNTDEASTDTYTLLGLTTKNGKDGKAVKVSTDKAIKSMESYGLECK